MCYEFFILYFCILFIQYFKQGKGKENATEDFDSVYVEQNKEMVALFGQNILDGGPAIGASTPYGETSIMDFGIDFR